MPDNDDANSCRYASSPCLAHEIDPTYFDPLAVDPQQALDVSRWRKAERAWLLAQREALPVSVRQAAAKAIAEHLDEYIIQRFGSIAGLTISGWCPVKAELDLRGWLGRLAARDARAAMPVVVKRAAPLAFRLWTPETPMERGSWHIPVPAETSDVVPGVMLSPVVGWDPSGHHLGYGGGYFDRTLAALSPRPMAIGIGLDAARIVTIFPQPHDIPMAAIITETGIQELNQ